MPLAARLTVAAEPAVTAVLIVEVPLLPCMRVRLMGEALMVKSLVGGAGVLRVTSS
jgi:hypothetical protein